MFQDWNTESSIIKMSVFPSLSIGSIYSNKNPSKLFVETDKLILKFRNTKGLGMPK